MLEIQLRHMFTGCIFINLAVHCKGNDMIVFSFQICLSARVPGSSMSSGFELMLSRNKLAKVFKCEELAEDWCPLIQATYFSHR
jgi:hypothetical protein